MPTTNMKMNSLRSRRLEVVSERKNERARGRHASPLVNLRVDESKDFWDSLHSKRFRAVSEQRTRTKVKHHTKNSASNPNHPPPPSVSFFGSRSLSCAAKTESLVPRAFFAPKPNGNSALAMQATSGSTETVTGDRGKNGL